MSENPYREPGNPYKHFHADTDEDRAQYKGICLGCTHAAGYAAGRALSEKERAALDAAVAWWAKGGPLIDDTAVTMGSALDSLATKPPKHTRDTSAEDGIAALLPVVGAAWGFINACEGAKLPANVFDSFDPLLRALNQLPMGLLAKAIDQASKARRER